MRFLRLGVVALMGLISTSEVVPAESPAPGSKETLEFNAFLDKVHAAQIEFVQGRPAAFKALYSRRPDATIFGGFGSGDKGWDQIGPRLDWGSAQFSEGSRSREVLASALEGDVGYVVQLERIRFKVPESGKESLLELRATMIMRREAEGWRIIHRHADSQMERQAPRRQ